MSNLEASRDGSYGRVGTPRAVACCVVLIIGGCSQAPACGRLGGAPMLEYQLFFGRAAVTDRAWADFTTQAVTPHLPDGFTVLDAYGQWMNPATQRIAREPTKVIVVAVPDAPASATAIAAIKDAYRTQFHQQSVGTVVHPVCGAF
jgi:hypothetical protein